jgi:hypothetical protein
MSWTNNNNKKTTNAIQPWQDVPEFINNWNVMKAAAGIAIGTEVNQLKGELFNKVFEVGIDGAGNVFNAVKQQLAPKGGGKSKGGKANVRGFAKQTYESVGASAPGYSLSKAPTPVPISLSSGIRPNTYVNDYMSPVEDNCSPLHFSTGIVRIPSTSAYALYEYYSNVIAFDIQSKAQGNVSFSLDILNNFTADNILSAMNSVLYALQIYYYYASIIGYHSNPKNKNLGMLSIRQRISAQELEWLSILGRRLMDTPVPPRFLDFVRYLSGTFSTSSNPGSPLIKIAPINPNENMTYKNGELSNALSALSTPTHMEIFSLLRRAVPHWVPSSLPDVPMIPVYDDNFSTIFANLPLGIFNPKDKDVHHYPHVNGAGDEFSVPYNSYSNNLDGLAFALMGISLNKEDDSFPGLFTPVVNPNDVKAFGSTRASYYEVAGNKRFCTPSAIDYLARARAETFAFKGDGSATIYPGTHLFGADKCLGVDIQAVRLTAQRSLDWLMSLDTINRGVSSKLK